MDGHDGGALTLSPFYHSAVNAVTEPNRLVFCSRYLITRWSPLLGGTGLQILLYLRGLCFHDRRTGEVRNVRQVSRAEIAAATGVSEATVKRELAHNEALGRFVQPQQEYRLDGGRGGLRRDANSYRIAMDDPVHPDDEARVEAYVREAEARQDPGVNPEIGPEGDAEAAKRRAREAASQSPNPARNGDETAPSVRHLAPGQIDPAQGLFAPEAENSASGQIDPAPNHPVLRRVNLTPASGQIDPTLNGRYLRVLKEQTLNVRFGINCVDTHDAGAGGAGPREQAVTDTSGEDRLDRQAAALAEELNDWGSERRHRQLLSLCERHGLSDLPRQALRATRERLAREGRRGPVEKPGAYYARILVALLAERQVFVPTAAEAGEEDPEAVRAQIRASLGLADGPDDSPADAPVEPAPAQGRLL